MNDNSAQPQPNLTLTVVGFIWDGGDGFDVTVRMEGQADFTRVHIPALVDHARKVCAERGITMGDLCDEMNREIDARERAEWRRRGMPSVEFTFTSIDTSLYDVLTRYNRQTKRFHVQWTATDGQTTREAYVQAVSPQVAVNQFDAAGGMLGEGTITVTEVDAPENVTTFYARHGNVSNHPFDFTAFITDTFAEAQRQGWRIEDLNANDRGLTVKGPSWKVTPPNGEEPLWFWNEKLAATHIAARLSPDDSLA